MDKCLGVESSVFFNNKIIKVYDGIAGSAKSTNVTTMLRDAGVSFGRYTSTNKLKRDAFDRFGGDCYTIAGGLFESDDGEFFTAEKGVKYDAVIIDEILQTDRRVLEWASSHVGLVNIIICTDSRQMLVKGTGERFLEQFKDFCKRPDVLYTKLNKSFRPANEATAKHYSYCYERAEGDRDLYKVYKGHLPSIPFEKMEYDPENVYICHTNEIEEYLYSAFNIDQRYDLPLIPKGKIASKPPVHPEKYPIMPQSKATKNHVYAYFQPENIGTVTRYQGSEVEQGHKLYFLVEKNSVIVNREFYTMLTRAKDFHDIVLVYCDIPKDTALTTYNGYPVKKASYMVIDENTVLDDGSTIGDHINPGEKSIKIPASEYYKILDNLQDTETEHYTSIICEGKHVGMSDVSAAETKVSIHSLLKKDPALRNEHANAFFRKLEESQLTSMEFFGARICNAIAPDRTDYIPDINAGRCERKFKYGIDLYSAYPHCFALGAIPDGRTFTPGADDKWRREARPADASMVDYYITWDANYTGVGTVCTGDFVRFMQKNDPNHRFPCFYLGSFPRLKSCRTADYLIKESYRSKESKANVKQIRYGVLRWQYLQEITGANNQIEGYCLTDSYRYEHLMCAIVSELALTMMKLRKAIYGDIRHGRQKVDCLYFNTTEDITALGDRLRKVIPGYDFRIFDYSEKMRTDEEVVLYQTYAPLKTAREIDNEKRKERRKRA